MAGVFCGDLFFTKETDLRLSVILLLALSLLTVVSYFFRHYSLRWCFGIAVSALCVVGGWVAVTWQLQQSVCSLPEKETVYKVQLTDDPEQKERSYLCRVDVEEYRDSSLVCPLKKKVLLYIAPDSLVTSLHVGDKLWVSARIAPPINGKNFDEFDYGRYLMRQGVCGTGYVASGKWIRISEKPSLSAHVLARSYRDRLISLYERLGFEGDELAVLSALTVGDKTELSESIRESYSVSGASHVLALSGLHIGLLYMLLSFSLKWLTLIGCWGRCIRSLLVLLMLGAFAFFTGLSPSVVRAVCMCSILAIAGMFGRQTISLNTVAAVAWWMLLFHPVWLFDVGFQLSFVAVVSILLFQKRLYVLLPVKSWLGRQIWGLMTVSVSAQLGTAPLVIFYFSRFSTHFLLTNLVVVPLVTIILYVAVLMLLLTPFNMLQTLIAGGCNSLLKFLNGFVRWIEQLPYSSIDNIWLYVWEVVGMYLFFILFLHYTRKRRACHLMISLSCLLILAIGHVSSSWMNRPERSLVFYNVRGCPAVHCIERDGKSWLNYADGQPDGKRLCQVASNYWRRIQLSPPTVITADVSGKSLSRNRQLLSYYGCRVGMITDDRWRNKSSDALLPMDYLYICKGYGGSIDELLRLFQPSCVVLDSSLPTYRLHALQKECKQRRLNFISLNEEGSVCFLL